MDLKPDQPLVRYLAECYNHTATEAHLPAIINSLFMNTNIQTCSKMSDTLFPKASFGTYPKYWISQN